jgi:hypothetical protein
MNILSCADSNFFHCLRELSESVQKFYDKPLIVYDLGLSEEQKGKLKAIILPVPVEPGVDYHRKAYLSPDGRPSTRAAHKPFCVRDYFQRYSEPMILVDADCLFTEKVEEHDFDVGVTYTPRKSSTIEDCYNGIINSGVIFFNNPADGLVNRWAEECRAENTTDQKAMSDILSETVDWSMYKQIQDWQGLKIKIFDTRKYNDYHLKGGKILHFINTKHDKETYEKLIAGYKKGKNIRRLFREVKRGKKSRVRVFIDKLMRT